MGSSLPNSARCNNQMDVFALSTCLSFGLLGTVLLYCKFDAYYGGLCLFISALGYWFQFLLILPYFMVVWRVLIGRHVKTDAKLLIGRHRRSVHSAESTSFDSTAASLSHWIVAIRPENSERYLMTHATGEVVSGLGERRPYVWRDHEWIERRYEMHHVGWVMRREREEHMQRVYENEPMASGYTCQEFAVDIAFQISSSRTYTSIKCITLLRVRTMIYFSLVIFSTLLFLWQKCTSHQVIVLVPINPELFNPMMTVNVFLAIEAYRMGYTNLRKEKNIWKGFKDRINVYFRIISHLDIFKLIILFLFSTAVQIWMNNTMLTVSILMVAIIMAKD